MKNNQMKKNILTIGFVLAAISVIIGAFGAHGLNEILVQNNRLETFETGVKYLFYHTFGIIILGLVYKPGLEKIKVVFYLFLAGIIIFSGSLFILSISNITMFGAITPIGGVCFIAGWIYLAILMKKYN